MMIILMIIILIFLVLILLRNEYTTYCIIEAIKLIGVYKTYLIHKNKYVMDFDYCSEMMISHITHMFSFWLFGKYSAIKPEYRDALIAFKIKNDKTIKENAKNAENIRQLHIQEMKENLKNML